MNSVPTIAVLLCTYNGDRFLEKQLNSITQQTYPNWTLHISDDGSRDSTLEIIKKFQNIFGANRIKLYRGPSKGFVANFMSLVYNTEIIADFYAFSDQDDIWEKDKFERAISFFQAHPTTKPLLYCSRTRLLDSNENEIGFSTLYKRSPCFQHAMVENIASGNTMVFNQFAMSLLRKVNPAIEIVIHDWWTYIVVAACGGIVFYDENPTVRYRQHDQNLIGAKLSWFSNIKKLRLLFNGFFAQRSNIIINSLLQIQTDLTSENKIILEQFQIARQKSFFPRIIGIMKSGIFCQSFTGKIKLATSILLKKI